MHLCSMDLGEIISRYASMMMAFFAPVPFHVWILLQSALFMFCVTLVHLLALDCTLDLGCILGTTHGVWYLRLYLL